LNDARQREQQERRVDALRERPPNAMGPRD